MDRAVKTMLLESLSCQMVRSMLESLPSAFICVYLRLQGQNSFQFEKTRKALPCAFASFFC